MNGWRFESLFILFDVAQFGSARWTSLFFFLGETTAITRDVEVALDIRYLAILMPIVHRVFGPLAHHSWSIFLLPLLSNLTILISRFLFPLQSGPSLEGVPNQLFKSLFVMIDCRSGGRLLLRADNSLGGTLVLSGGVRRVVVLLRVFHNVLFLLDDHFISKIKH